MLRIERGAAAVKAQKVLLGFSVAVDELLG
jgi:hypothetical protein